MAETSNSKKKISYENRVLISLLHSQGLSQRAIAKKVGCSLKGVHYCLKRKKKTGLHSDRPRPKDMKTVRTKKNIKRVMKAITKIPKISARKLAKILKLGRTSTRMILKEDLQLKPYKMVKYQMLSKSTKLKRFERCKELVRRFSGNFENILFTDEKIFTVEQAANTQNTRVWTIKEKRKKLTKVLKV